MGLYDDLIPGKIPNKGLFKFDVNGDNKIENDYSFILGLNITCNGVNCSWVTPNTPLFL